MDLQDLGKWERFSLYESIGACPGSLAKPQTDSMNPSLSLLLAACLALPAAADYETWTNKEGQEASLELYQVTEVGGEKVGKFRTKSGKSATIRQSQLSEADAKRLANWVPQTSGPDSVFDDFLWGKLVTLEGEEFKPALITRKPGKYYAFYYTASWCGPCRKFTPLLVDWYEENKNDNIEIFLISSDRGEEAMLNYAKSKHMPWPHVVFDQVRTFKAKFREKHGVRGIPMLIVCDAEGKVLGNYRSQLPKLGQMIK